MSFNINKCHTLHAHRKKQPIIHTYTMDNTPVTPVTHHPYLGIELQADLRWTTHIQNTTNKAQKTLNMLKRNLKQAFATVKSQAYKTLAIWAPHTAKDTYNLNNIQNYAARWVHHDYSHYTSVSSLQKQLNWPSLSVRCLQCRPVLFYKICHQNIVIPIPPYLQIPLRTTRRTSNINENSYRYRQLSTATDTYKYSYFPRTIAEWYSLPPSLWATSTVQSFKEGLTSHLSSSL